jgi:predicted dehydrogenase
MRAIKWGILGLADIAVARTIPAMHETPSADPWAVASRDPARARDAAQRLGIPHAYDTYEDLLADPQVEAVYIPLPNHLHLEWSMRALQAGKAVLCEKPLCLTTSEVGELIKARDREGGRIEEALVFRNHPQWAAIDEILESGSIGRPLAVQGTIAKQFLDPEDIRNNPDLGGGAVYDLGPYVIGACNLVFQRPPLRVCAALERDPDFGVDRLVTALLDYGDAHATFTASSQGGTAAWATHQQFSVLATKGWLRADFPYAQARPFPCSVEVGDETSVGAFPSRTLRFMPVNQYELQIERFSQLVAGGTARAWPIEDSLLTLTVMEALFESARCGEWADIKVGL